jgi:hypothetical protein
MLHQELLWLILFIELSASIKLIFKIPVLKASYRKIPYRVTSFMGFLMIHDEDQ